MHYLHFFVIILIFIRQIKIIDNSLDDGQKNEPDSDLYRIPPLKVVLPKYGTDYVLPSSSELSMDNRNIDYHYLCPMTENDMPKFKTEIKLKWTIEKQNCLKPIYIKPEEKVGSCTKDFTFSITQVDEEIDNVDVFIFGYDKSVKLEIYKVYVDATTKQTLHTEHRIISQKPISSPDFETYMEELKLTYSENFLKELPRAYRNLEPSKPKPKNILRSFLSRVSSKLKKQKNKDKDKDKTKDTDYLIPQVLVSFTDLEPSSARGANLNYLNIRPQYKRLRATWDSINGSIWYELFIRKLHRRTKIYTSTSRILIHNNKKVKIYVDKKFQIYVPLLWWHLIVTDDGRAIIILLYNVPLDFPPIPKTNLICETICSATGWNNIQKHDQDKNIYVQCCEASNDFLKYLGFIKSDQVLIQNILNFHDIIRNPKGRQTKQTEDEEKSIDDFVTNKPLLLLKKGFTESTFDSTSMSSDAGFSFLTESVVQGCPEYISGNDCIRVVSTETPSTSITCSREVQPNIVPSETPCADEGILYTFQYNVCYNEGEEEEGEVKFAKTPMLYSVCYDKKKKETIYTTHKISTDELISVNLDAKIYIKQLKTYCADNDVRQDLENMAIFYEKYIQQNVVPQMLVPLVDMDLSYVLSANLHYLNIRPQYKRIADRWDEINAQILQYLLENELNKEVNIYTGTILQLPNNSVITELKLNDQFSINIPMIWGKIITLDSKSIVILIYNIPFKHHLTPKQRLCEKSICTTNNWLDIETDENENSFNANNVHVQCCETTEDVLNHFRLSHIRKEISGEFEILKLPEKLTNPDALANEDDIGPIND